MHWCVLARGKRKLQWRKTIVKVQNTVLKITKYIPKKYILVVLNEYHANAGPDAYKQWKVTVGKFGLGETNYRGIIPLGFAQSQQLTLANTLHLHKKLRTATWHLQDGLVHNQIDYILLPRCFKSSINKTKTRTYPGANIGSDYGLVPTNLKLKLNMKAMRVSRFKIQNLNITRTRFDLKNPEGRKVFRHWQSCSWTS